MHLLLEFFDAIGSVPKAEDIYKFSHQHFFLATWVAFGVVSILIIVLSSSILEFMHSLSGVKFTRRVTAIVSSAVILTLGAAASCVYLLHNSLEPLPTFEGTKREFVREPVVLTWQQNTLAEDENLTEPVVFRVQSALNPEFTEGLVERARTDGHTLYDFEDGVRWWRVLPELNGNPLTKWSRPTRTTYYRNAFTRIKSTKRLRVYVSNSINQGIFKFVDSNGQLSGADIRIAERIANALATELQVKIPKPTPVPIAWTELLKQPSEGAADLVISSISKSDARENANGLKFSSPYFCTGQSILFRKGAAVPPGPIKDYFRDKIVGYQEGTTSEKLINEYIAQEGKVFTPKSFKEAAALVQAIENPNSPIQVVLTDTPFALNAALAASNADKLDSIELPESDYPEKIPPLNRVERYAVGVAQGETQLLNVIDGLIANMKANGELDRILQAVTEAKFPNLDPRERSRLHASKPCPDENRVQTSLMSAPPSAPAVDLPHPIARPRPRPASMSRSR